MPDDRPKRGTYIGSQQIAAVIGAHPYQTAADVWAHAVYGNAPDISNRPAVRRGLIVEPGFLDWIERERGITLRRDVFLHDPDVPFFGGTADGIDDENGTLYEVTSCTTRTLYLWGEESEGANGIATYKRIQSQWLLGLGGIARVCVGLFVTDTGEVRFYSDDRNDDQIAALRDAGEAFWFDHVVPQIAPPLPDDPQQLRRMGDRLDRVFPGDDDETAEATPEIVQAANAYAQARDEAKAADAIKRETSTTIKAHLGNASRCKWEGGRVAWTRNKSKLTTDYRGALLSLVDGEITQEVADAAIEKFTTEQPGPRVLRVTIKAADNTSDKEKNDD